MFAENRSKRQNSQKGIGEKPPPKAEFPKGGWFLKRFSLKLFKNHNFSKNSFKKQNSQKFIGEKPPPKAEFPKGGWFLKGSWIFSKTIQNVFWKDSEVECGSGKPSLKAKHLLQECAFLKRFSLNLLKNICIWRERFSKECGFGKTTSESTILAWKVVL